MRLQIVVAQPLALTPCLGPSDPAGLLGSSANTLAVERSERWRPARQVLDVFIDGANVTALVRETHGGLVLRDLALALVELSRRSGGKSAVRFYDEPWELCVERFGPTACLSVYRLGPDPLVAVYDRAVPFDDVVGATLEAIDQFLSPPEALLAARLELASAAEHLRAFDPPQGGKDVALPEPLGVVIEADRDSPVSFSAEFALRPGAQSTRLTRPMSHSAIGMPDEDAVERTDMHALLFRGRVRAEIRGRGVDLGECHPVFFAERLVELARRAFDAWERGLPLHARSHSAGLLLGMRLSTAGEMALTLGRSEGGPRRPVHTFPALGVSDVLEAALAFGRALVRAVIRRDRSQTSNLRLAALRRALRESTDALRQAHRTESKVNLRPEPYRAFAAALDEVRAAWPAPVPASRLRYGTRWRAVVPGIDLRATYLCGERLIVGASTEMWALDRASGRVLWQTDVPRGTSVVTPGGVARLGPDGTLGVYDLASGARTLRTRIAPRLGGPIAGAVVNLPGLPRLILVTEGEHHLVAIDLTTGELRWRWSWGAGRSESRGAPRMKRFGRLAFFTCGDVALTAIDVLTGAVVWRLRDRLRFRTPPTVQQDALFVVAGGAHGVARLYCVDPYSGEVRWQTALGDASAPCTVLGAPLASAGAVGVAVRQKSGVALALYHKGDGSPIAPPPAHAPACTPGGTSWLAVDDAFIGNAPTGELMAIDARSGELAWRHVLGPRPLEADVPRRLEPVLRCGALFVPCSLFESAPPRRGRLGESDAPTDQRAAAAKGEAQESGVCVIRPSDGALIGAIAPSEAIPDLLRVDEHCGVYVAEESGHLVAFAALPRLSLVENPAP